MKEQFVKDRNEALASGDVEKMIVYCKKYGIKIPEDKKQMEAGFHKAICNQYFAPDNLISIEQYTKSMDWLSENGFSPEIK